jgi:hypothetical protein
MLSGTASEAEPEWLSRILLGMSSLAFDERALCSESGRLTGHFCISMSRHGVTRVFWNLWGIASNCSVIQTQMRYIA